MSVPDYIGTNWAATPRPVAWCEVNGVERGVYPVRPAIHGKGGSYLYAATDDEPVTKVPEEFWDWEPIRKE